MINPNRQRPFTNMTRGSEPLAQPSWREPNDRTHKNGQRCQGEINYIIYLIFSFVKFPVIFGTIFTDSIKSKTATLEK